MNTSWSHRLVRPLVPALIRLKVTPNQVTGVRLVLGLAGVAATAWGSETARLWGGALWLLCCLGDRLDGELARLGDMCSPEGARFDMAVDRWISALFFLGLGLSVHAGAHPLLGAACGGIACLAQLANSAVADRFDTLSPNGDKVIPSKWGFDADDALYVLGPLAWLSADLRLGADVLAAVGTTAFLAIFTLRLSRLRRRMSPTGGSAAAYRG